MKKLFNFLIALLITSTTVFGFSGNGSGTSGDPYLVTTAAQLAEVANGLTYYYRQMNDIDISSYPNWTAIGATLATGFTGTYDGNGYKVTGLKITSTSAMYNGLFGIIGDGATWGLGTVKNLGIVGASVTATQNYSGILVGYNYGGVIQNCYTTGTISSSANNVGGFTGSTKGVISACYSTASVTGSTSATQNAGGFAGSQLTFTGQTPTIQNCYATGSVSGKTYVGGFIGFRNNNSNIINSYSTGSVTGTTIGGFAGTTGTGSTTSCFWDTQTSGQSSSAGGEIGKTTAEMQTASTFSSAGWSTSIWSLVDGRYPILAWQLPTITAISPTNGVAGTSVSITGTNFTGATSVKFNGTNAIIFTINSATSITATSPAGSGTADVTVTTSGGTSATSAADQFTYVAAPTITSISPSNGLTTGGTAVSITGTNLSGTTAVKFGSSNAGSFTVNSATSISATSPSGSGTVDITVTTIGGTSATSAADKFIYLAPGTWTGLANNSNWTDAGNWSDNLVPTATTNVTIPAAPLGGYLPIIFSGDAADCNNFTTAPDFLEIQSSSSGTGSLIVHGTATGLVQTDFYLPKDQWHVVAPACDGYAINDFLNNGVNQNYLAQKDVSGTIYYGMTDYDEKNNKWNEYFTLSTPGSLTSGKGYSLRTTNNSFTLMNLGNIVTGTKTVSLTKEGEGWNCIGNPYTSAIGMNSLATSTENFLTKNSGSLESSYACVYVWDPTSSTYQILGNLPTGLPTERSLVQNYLQSGQGFFVKAKDAASSIQFTPAMQSHQTGVEFKSATTAWSTVTLKASSNQTSTSAILAFNNQMTKGLDPTYDAGLLRGSNGLSLYTKLVDDNGVDFAIQCLPENGAEQMVIPVGLDAKAGGEVKFSATTTGLSAGCSAILEDRTAKVYSDLSNGGEYAVTLSANSNGTGRFYLHMSNQTTGNNLIPETSFNLKAYLSDEKIRIDGKVSGKAFASLFDARGSQIGCYKLEEGLSNSIPASGLTSGVYILKIVDGDNIFNTKLVLISNQ